MQVCSVHLTVRSKNVTLTGMKIDGGQNVGALIGSVSDTVKITNTRVYLSSKKGDLADIETVDSRKNRGSRVKSSADLSAW